MPGIAFTPVQFTPKASVFKNELCQGVYISILNRSRVRPVALGIQMALTLHKLYPEAWDTQGLNRLLRHEVSRRMIESDAAFERVRATWQEAFVLFKQRRAAFLLY
jgi:uncharacterized protein YbbC (DUF1343 family)